MSQEITVRPSGEVAQTQTGISLRDAIVAVVQNPQVDVSKMEALVRLQIEMDKRSAEIEFAAAMARIQPKMPRVQKNGVISAGANNKQKFMKYEDVDLAVRPLLAEEGFTFSFDTDIQDGKVAVSGTIAHRFGHSKTSKIVLPVDTSGSKNSTQGVGSTVSYGKRYLVCMMLNIIAEGEDNDGAGGRITQAQAQKLQGLILETNSDRDKFLGMMGVEHLGDILVKDYSKAEYALSLKKRGS